MALIIAQRIQKSTAKRKAALRPKYEAKKPTMSGAHPLPTSSVKVMMPKLGEEWEKYSICFYQMH
jgi:hypothetical protein